MKDPDDEEDFFNQFNTRKHRSCVSEEAIDSQAFIKGMSKIYFGTQDDHLDLVFQMYVFS